MNQFSDFFLPLNTESFDEFQFASKKLFYRLQISSTAPRLTAGSGSSGDFHSCAHFTDACSHQASSCRHPICVTTAAVLNIIRLLTYNLAGPRPRKNALETRLHWFSVLSAKSTAKIVSGQNTCYYIHSSYRPSLYGWRGLGENEVEGT